MVIKVEKINKILIVLIIVFLMSFICSQVFAINPETYRPDDPTIEEAKLVTDKVAVVLGAVRNISTVVAVIAIMIIGVKYILGSVEEKANYKATMLPYVIGCVMAVAGTTLVSFIYNSVHS